MRLYVAALLVPLLLLTACSSDNGVDLKEGIAWAVRAKADFGDDFRMNYLTGDVIDTRLYTPQTNFLENREEKRPDAINKAKKTFCEVYFARTAADKVGSQWLAMMDFIHNSRAAAVAKRTHKHANATMQHADEIQVATEDLDSQQLWEETYLHLVEQEAEIEKARSADCKSLADILPNLQKELTNYCDKHVPGKHPSAEDLGYPSTR